MSTIAIIVEFEAQPGRENEVRDLLAAHARRTLAQEPGCLRFEVLEPLDTDGEPLSGRVVVNELYADRAAVDAHEGEPRLAQLREALAPLLRSRRRLIARCLDDAPEPEGLRPEQLTAANDG